MAQITSSVGLISGINTGQIINELMSINSQPVTLLQNRVNSSTAQKTAYTDLGGQLQVLQQVAQALQLPTTFAASTATSSDPTVLTATAGVNAAVGSYGFDVASLVTSQQSISTGYSSPNSLVGAGTLSISLGGGEASSQTTLAQLNGGTGVASGQFRITDGSGNSAIIDTSKDVTLDDVVNQINNSLNVSVRASIKDDHLVLTDLSGETKNNFSVQDLGAGQTAAQLGIVGTTTGTLITGSGINTINVNTPLAQLNDGRGVGSAAGASDFQVNLAGGNFQVSLGNASTLGQVISAINTASGGQATASIDAATNSLTIKDNTTGGGTFSVAGLNSSTAAADLGLTGAATGSTLQGNTLLASLDSVLVSSLNGGNGLPLGTIHITNRNNVGADVILSNAKSVQDIIDDINKAGLNVTASLNNAGDGIALTDNTGDSGNLVVSDVGSTTAAALGLAGTYAATQTTVQGAALHAQYVSHSTLLSDYNGGQGVDLGTFTITNSKGGQSTIDLGQGSFKTIGDVIGAINAKNLGVTASINSTGDGLLLTDTAGGAGKLAVADVSGTAAADLSIAGTATGTTINGSQTKTIAVTNTDTLTTLQQKISTLGFGVSASIINDGSGSNGYHLALTALNSGKDGRVVIDGGTTSLQTTNVVNAQNAAVFYGGSGAAAPLLVTSSSNQLTGIVPGVTIQLTGTGNVTLNVARDSSGIATQLQTFATTYNDLITEIATLTSWNSTTNQGGLLLGDATVEDIQSQLSTVFDSVVQGAGQYHLLSDLGLSLNGDGTVKFDPTKFDSAYASNPADVQNLFTQAKTGLATVLNNSMTELVDPVTGELTLTEGTLTSQISGFQTSINQLNAVLSNQRNQLESEYANMETVLASLKEQQSTLSSITSITSSGNVSSSASSSSGSSSG